ncbi:MAG: C10 family peptidase [Alistipes sp.]|nr:C10 family peptidase [Alistipes sp.]
MKRFCIFASVVLFAAISCQREVVEVVECGEPTAAVESSPYAISKEEALGRLEDFMAAFDGEDTRSRSRVVKSISAVRGEDIMAETRGSECEVENLLYIAEFEDGCGSAILGADSRLEPVYAVLDETVMTIDDFRAAANGEEADDVTVFNAKLITTSAMSRLSSNATLLPEDDFRTDIYDNIQTIEYLTYIMPMIPTKWNQTHPYNIKFPMKTASNGVSYRPFAGCASVAIGQLLAYLQPTSTVVINGRSHSYSVIAQCNIHNDFLSNSYLVDKLGYYLYDLAEEMDATYTDTGTSIATSQSAQMLRKAGLPWVQLIGLDEDIIYYMLENGKPVPIRAENTEGSGHIWLIDGRLHYLIKVYKVTLVDDEIVSKEFLHSYLNDYVHCNFGWGGRCDGYYNYNIYSLPSGLGSEPEYGDIDVGYDAGYDIVYNSEFMIIRYNL